MPKPPPEPPTRQEVIDALLTTVPTSPEELDWRPLLTKNTLRLRMNATPQDASEELIEAYRNLRYPDVDIPEVRGLLRCLEEACRRAGIPYGLEPGQRGLITGLVGHFEPHKIRLPFAHAKLALAIAPGEFQWVLSGAKKERGPDGHRVESLKRELRLATQEWVRRGNRYEGSLFA